MLFYSSYHSFIAKGVENSPLEHHTEHPKNESSFRNGQVVMFQSLQPCKIFNCRRGVFYSRKNTVEAFSVNIILFSFPMVIFRCFLRLIFFHFYFKRSTEVIVSFQLAICGGNTVFPYTTAYSFRSNFN